MNPKTSRLLTLALIAGGLVLLIYIVATTWPNTRSSEGRLGLLRLKNVALGHMENAAYDQAIPDLKRIAAEQAADPLGHRNLTIALYAPDGMGQSGSPGRPEQVASLLHSTERMLAVEPESPLARLVAARVFRERADKTRGKPEMKSHLDQAREHYRKAGALAPQDPAPAFGLYRLEVDFVNADDLSKEGMEALTTAARRAPNNVSAQLELAYWQAMKEQTAVRGTLEKVLNLLPAGNAAAGAELAAALEILKKDMERITPEIIQRISVARNLLQTDTTYRQGMSDLAPHPLDFVIEDFLPSFYENLPPDAEKKIKVTFSREPLPGTDKVGAPIAAAAWEDLTGTGEFAAVLVQPGPNATRVTTHDPRGKKKLADLELAGTFDRALLADLDFDVKPVNNTNQPADLDLILFGPSGVRVLENRDLDGVRAWIDRTADAKLSDIKEVRWLTVCDLDHDGNLDLVVATATGTQLLRNTGAWLFEDITERSTDVKPWLATDGVWGDFDHDGDLDLYLRTSSGELVFLENLRGGRFKGAKVAVDGLKPDALLTFDANNDGLLDLLVGHERGAILLLSAAQGLPHEATHRLELPAAHRVLQAGTVDYDNDGWLDVWLVTADPLRPLRLFHNQAGQSFEDVSLLLPETAGPIQAVLPADVDQDGDIDLLVISPTSGTVLRNDGGNQNRWLDLRLRALLIRQNAPGQAAKVNYYGIGSTLEVKAGRHYQKQQVHGTTTHFGLGQHKQAEVARIVWTNGVPQVIIRPRIDTTITEDQRPKGSCPFLYTWDGERFVMVTDCLWSSALGMKLAHGVDMDHHRQHNYLIVPGGKLKPRDDRYLLQFTNELWEVPYLDQAQLWVVDHPADVDVFTNQRVPPSSTNDFRFITVKEKRRPVAAHDQASRDVLGLIAKQDGVFLDGFRRQRYVGLVEPHYLELDLGDLSSAKEATLFLTGWIWPTDTTGNVAISQDPRFRGVSGAVGGVAPPALLVPDGKGGWTTALPMMGFPCGKMQTVAVELPLERFPIGDYRVRIATSMELYWDEIFLCINESPAPLEVQRLAPARADLHHRGYGRVYQESPSGPQLYDYYDVDPSPIWRPIPGPYTRHGEVTGLLLQADSQYAAMSPGDELTLEFAALPPPPAGKRRTFLFYANGWLKDFDMNGASSEAAAPLPFEGMSRYPYREPEQYPNSPELQRFLREYMTRDVKPLQPKTQ